MVDAFATYQDLEARLNRAFSVDEQAWITTLLEDASTYLRGVIGQTVYPATVSTFVGYPQAGRLDLPQYPVVAVTLVERDGAALVEGTDYAYRPGYLVLDSDDPVEVTFSWGYTLPPDELKRLACVLVSQALVTLEAGIGITAGGLSSVALDDFKAAWADGGESSGMVLTRHAEASVKAQFGRGDSWVVDAR
jgi:hypothetical protein